MLIIFMQNYQACMQIIFKTKNAVIKINCSLIYKVESTNFC